MKKHIPFYKLPWQPLYFYTLGIFSIGRMFFEIESAQHLFLLIIHIKLIHDTRGKHLHDRIIWQREEIRANKTNFHPATFYWSSYTKTCKWVVKYLCVRISILILSTILSRILELFWQSNLAFHFIFSLSMQCHRF